MSQLFDLSGKTAIVTGANTGLGQGIALALAEAGAAWVTGQEGVVLRHFVCPGCARLLDTETAMADDPPLHDRV